MAFISKGTLDPHGAPVLRQDILTNSVTFTVGNALVVTSGFPTNATSGSTSVYGILEALETNKAVGLNTTGAAGALIGSFINAYTTSSTNQTVNMVRSATDISRETLYTVALTAAPGTTTGSNLLGYFLNLSTAAILNEASATTTGTAGIFWIWGVDPQYSTTNDIVSLHQSTIFGVDG